MTTLTEIQSTIETELNALNQRIRTQLGSDNNLMSSVVDNYLRTKGKQIRPIVVILTAKMVGNINDKVISAAAAVELLHNGSLIHDDVMDNSAMRRNSPTINAVWNNHIAVLVGDFFVSSSMQQAISTNDIQIIDSLCHLGKLLSLGELDQIYNARYHSLTEDSYFRIINHKTASLFVACAKMGCYAVGVNDDRMHKMAQYAELLGLCFQIRDDIYDYFPTGNIGKPTGHDLKEGKITLPLLYALNRNELPDQEQMKALTLKEILSDDDIAILTAYARDNGGIEYAYAKMKELRTEAFKIIDTLPESEARTQLKGLFDIIIES